MPTKPRIASPDDTVAAPQTTDLPTAGTAAANKLWAALRAHPTDGTTVQLASMAGIGRSTAAKILARWASDGIITRTTAAGAGSTGRGPERWSLPGPAATTTTADLADDDPVDDIAADAPMTTLESPPIDDNAPDATPTTTPTASGRSNPTDATPRMDADSSHADSSHADSSHADSSHADSGSSDASDAALDAADGPQTAAPTRTNRLPPGGLRGMVEDHLREHPDQAFGPSQLGKALGRSGGAVANALLKLLDAGTAVRAQAKPLRYRLAPAERSHPSTATETPDTAT